MIGSKRKPGGASLIGESFGNRGTRSPGKRSLTEQLSPAAHQDHLRQDQRSGPATAPEIDHLAGNDQEPSGAQETLAAEPQARGGPGAVQQAIAQGGGVPLPESVRGRMEQKLRADFSKVRIHMDAQSDQQGEALDAPAYTVGQHIFFRAGFGPGNEEILAHELTHVVQQGGAQPTKDGAKVGARDDAAEHEADKVSAAVTRGHEVPAISTGHDASTVRRFGAGFEKDGHGGVEKEAAGASGDSQGLLEMYSGNYMRDMNQLNVPTVFNGLQSLPKNPMQALVTSLVPFTPEPEKIGAKGALELTTAIIKANAILELGPKITDSLITKRAIGAYRPEEHIDNPMGTGAADTIVTNTDPTRKKGDDKKTPIGVGEPRNADGTVPTKMVDKASDIALDKVKTALGMGEKIEVVDAGATGADADRDRDLKGSAIPGIQVENPKLYEVSSSGLANHIFNSNESVKRRWLKAALLGSSPLGRSEFGAGSHAVEDYFSHSNFIEVALNSYIEQALSLENKNQTSKAFAEKVKANNTSQFGAATVREQHYYVDTLYDPKPDAKLKGQQAARQRQPITTGSFGGDDTKVSIAHVLLPSLPKLQDAILQTIDRAFGIAVAEGGGGWEKIKQKLAGTPEGSAGATLLEGCDSAGMVAPVPDIQLTDSFPWVQRISQLVPFTAAFSSYAGIYKKAQDLIGQVKKYAATARIPIPLPEVIEAINAEVQRIEQIARNAIKEKATAVLVTMVDSVSGRTDKDKEKDKDKDKDKKAGSKERGAPLDPKDPDAELKKDLGDALDYLHDSVEGLEEQTSIESRLKNGDLSQMPKAKVEALVGPVTVVKEQKLDDKGKQVVRTYYQAENPLPPSHSEVAKDHGPHEEVDHHHKRDNPDHPGNEAGSPFFSLARPLAVEAVKHCYAQLQVVWNHRPSGGDKSLFGDGKNYEYQTSLPGNSKALQAGVLDEADQHAKAEKQRAKAEGRHYLQDEQAEQIKAMPGVDRFLNLVDLFISHPDDSGWWKAIIDQQVAKDPEPIFQSILRRNKTRTNRKL